MRCKFLIGVASLCLINPERAFAEAASTTSEDAFGKLVGLEAIGLYDEGQVRGFNLENAGNYRIEGQYFARVSPPFFLIREATTVRIGVNALRYDFPAPSGVIEYDLARPEPGASLSVLTGRYALAGSFVDLTGNWGSKDGKVGAVVGIDIEPSQQYMNGAGGDFYGVSSVVRWEPAPAIHLTAFGHAWDFVADPGTGFVPAGDFLPPEVKRGVLRSQDWAKYHQKQQDLGLFGTAELGSGWKLGAAAFHSAEQYPRVDFNLVEFDNPEGDYHTETFVSAGRSRASNSETVTLQRDWVSGILVHHLIGTARFRQSINRNKPSLAFDTGDSNLDDPYPKAPEPDFTIDPRHVLDRTRQSTVGLGYRVGIGGRLELRADVQKTIYSKTNEAVDGTLTRGKSKPWLYSGSALFGVTRDLTVFGSYSRGLEESGVAPNSAVNRGEVLPAVLATQRELGARYSFTPNLSLIAGLFDTRKPTPGTGPDGRFDLVGEVRHRGFEASFAGKLTPRLNILAGIMILDATLKGPLVDNHSIGRVPVATPDHVALLNANWRLKWIEGLSFDATLTQRGKAYISALNTTKSELQTTLDLGTRYRFKVAGRQYNFRARLLNVFNSFYWQPDASGTLSPSPQRDLEFTLQTTF